MPSEMAIDWLRITIPFAGYSDPAIKYLPPSKLYKKVDVVGLVDEWSVVTTRTVVGAFQALGIVDQGYELAQAIDTIYASQGIPQTSPWDRGVSVMATTGRWGYDWRITDGEVQVMGTKTTPAPLDYLEGPVPDDDFLWYPKVKVDMGICIEWTGDALRKLESRLSARNLTIYGALSSLWSAYPAVHCARLDVAMDWKADHPAKQAVAGVKPGGLAWLFKQKLVGARTPEWIHNENGHEDEVRGGTLTIGKRSSQWYMRVYDKAKERYWAHGDSWLNPDDFWIRWEQELKGDLAQASFVRLCQTGDLIALTLDLLADKLRIYPSSARRGVLYPAMVGKKDELIVDWYYQLLTMDDRYRKHITLVHKAPYIGVSKLSYGKSLVAKLVAHTMQGGDPVALVAHWVSQAKYKLLDDPQLGYEITRLLQGESYDFQQIDQQRSLAQSVDMILGSVDEIQKIAKRGIKNAKKEDRERRRKSFTSFP